MSLKLVWPQAGDEFEARLASGRIRWRESPTTWGVWGYSDTQDLEKNFKVSKGRTTARGVEYDPAEQEEEAFDSLWQADGHTGVLGLCQDGAKGSLGKGNTSKGLGKGQGLAKGKGLAKGQGKSQQLAIKDQEVEDDEQDEEKGRMMKILRNTSREPKEQGMNAASASTNWKRPCKRPKAGSRRWPKMKLRRSFRP